MIDLHCHLLPGIDDGATDLEVSLAMARSAIAGGVDAIVATPHVSWTYANDPATFPSRVAEVQAAITAAGLPLQVLTGAEVAYGTLPELSEESLRACVLGGGKYLLLEPPYNGPVPFIDQAIARLRSRGYRVLLAHPERIGAFQRDLGLLETLVEGGCLCSVTASSVAGAFGRSVTAFTRELFARGLVHNLASDAHDAGSRSPALRRLLDEAVAAMPELEDHLDWLTVAAPRAIVSGQAPPGETPRIASKRGFLARIRRTRGL
ncbi:MAG: protein-tyrosine phosphatase [Thermoleophilaceae bacterium]|nr:protein-tyrosine phosphatase [Thermoleophilaceae bacterium]